MKKLVLASAVSALFAAPVAAFAQAKPAVPTLGQIFEASGITASGYIDAGYGYIKNGAGFVGQRVFDQNPNSFALNQFGLTMAKQPKEGFGGLVNLTVGRDATFIHSFPEGANPNPAVPNGAPQNTSTFDVTQAYAQYAGGPLTVIAGKFTTLHGTEVIAPTGNVNISRSILFGSVPFTHTGVRATWALSDTFSLIAGVNNGWDQLTDANKGKTLELGLTANPVKPLNIALSAYSGKENAAQSGATLAGPDGTRTSVDLVVSYQITDPLSIGIEYLNLQQKNFVNLTDGSTMTGKFSGFAGYITYMFSPKFRGTIRLESTDDKDGERFGQPATAQKFKEGTLTVAYLPADSFELRAELRQDQADQKVFSDSAGNTSKSQSSVALSALYKF
jgi:opacity protein-like surface antigen